MANYTPSNLALAQAKLTLGFQNSELRFRQPEVWNSYHRSGAISMPGLTEARTREDRTSAAYFTKATLRALGTARAHNHTGAHGDSLALTPTWVTKSDKFSMTLKQADNNVYSFQEEFNAEIQNSIRNIAIGTETFASNTMFAGRTQVNGVAVEGTFNAVTFAYEIVDATLGTRAIQISTTVMDLLAYSGNVTVYTDSIAFNKFRFFAAQGATNATNYSFQFLNITFVHSAGLNASAASLSYSKGFWIVVPDGTIGGLNWVPMQNRMGIQTSVNKYATLINPVDGLTYAVHSYETRADGTAVNGYTQDVVTEFEISIDVALEKAPLSVANESTLVAFALV